MPKASKAPDILLNRKQVEEMTGLSRPTIYRWMPLGKFPKPIKLGAKKVVWKQAEIQAWIDEAAA